MESSAKIVEEALYEVTLKVNAKNQITGEFTVKASNEIDLQNRFEFCKDMLLNNITN